MAPANLITAMQDVGFDYFMTPRQVGEAVIAGTQTLWHKTVRFDTGISATPSSVNHQTATKKRRTITLSDDDPELGRGAENKRIAAQSTHTNLSSDQ